MLAQLDRTGSDRDIINCGMEEVELVDCGLNIHTQDFLLKVEMGRDLRDDLKDDI